METTSLTSWQTDALTAIDAAFKAGYEAGRRAALAQVLQAAQAGLSVTDDPAQNIAALPTVAQMKIVATGRAKPGSVKQTVREFVLGASRSVTEHELGHLHPEINRSSRYMAFRNLATEGVIVKQGSGWVPAPNGQESPGAGAPGEASHRDNEKEHDSDAAE